MISSCLEIYFRGHIGHLGSRSFGVKSGQFGSTGVNHFRPEKRSLESRANFEFAVENKTYFILRDGVLRALNLVSVDILAIVFSSSSTTGKNSRATNVAVS